jgi:hypothetical protein
MIAKTVHTRLCALGVRHEIYQRRHEILVRVFGDHEALVAASTVCVSLGVKWVSVGLKRRQFVADGYSLVSGSFVATVVVALLSCLRDLAVAVEQRCGSRG